MNTFELMKDSRVKEEYLRSTKRKFFATKERYDRLIAYINSPEFDAKADELSRGIFNISIPQRHKITKLSSTKTRTVYTFAEEDQFMFTYLSFMLHKYDDRFADSLYSYIRGRSTSDLLVRVNRLFRNGCGYGYKIDIKSYADSVEPKALAKKLEIIIDDDPALLEFLKFVISRGQYYDKDELRTDGTGTLMGGPIHAFLMNVFLEDLDKEYEQKADLYARYVDDILMLCDSREKAEELGTGFIGELKARNLRINEEKTALILTEDDLVYLGFIIRDDDVIDVSPFTMKKLKRKVRIRGRRCRRALINGKMSEEEAVKSFFAIMNKALFGTGMAPEMGGKDVNFLERYAFIVNTDKSFREVDEYVQLYARYIPTGKFRAKNMSLRYEDLKKYGYRSCVREYYALRYGREKR